MLDPANGCKMSLDTFLENRSTGILAVFGVIFVLILGYLNYFIGSQISFSIFYLVPVFLLSWYVSRNAGILISMIAALAWLAADLASAGTYPYRVVPYWNAAVLFAFFLVTTVILSRLKAAYLHEQELSRIDFLTGVANARAFHTVAESEKARASRYAHPLTLAYLDIDNFKVVNDRFGHQVGDALLVWVAKAIRENIRATDHVARVGGDEFAILLPETGAEAGQFVLYKLQRVLLDIMQKNGWPVTFSIGAVTFLGQPETLDEMIQRADGLMYSAKNGGKNRIAQEVVGA